MYYQENGLRKQACRGNQEEKRKKKAARMGLGPSRFSYEGRALSSKKQDEQRRGKLKKIG